MPAEKLNAHTEVTQKIYLAGISFTPQSQAVYIESERGRALWLKFRQRSISWSRPCGIFVAYLLGPAFVATNRLHGSPAGKVHINWILKVTFANCEATLNVNV